MRWAYFDSSSPSNAASPYWVTRGLAAKSVGAAHLLLPLIGRWALTHELRFGSRAQAMAYILERESGLPTDDLPRSAAGQVDHKATDEHFHQVKAAVEQTSDDWRTRYRLSRTYDTAGDRKRARQVLPHGWNTSPHRCPASLLAPTVLYRVRYQQTVRPRGRRPFIGNGKSA